MSDAFIKKNIKLGTSFNLYVFRHSRALAKIPNGANVVLAIKGDEKFNRSSREMVKKALGRSKRTKLVEARKEGKRWVIRPLTEI